MSDKIEITATMPPISSAMKGAHAKPSLYDDPRMHSRRPISECLFWQGPLLSAPSGADALAAHHNDAGIQAYKQEQWNRAKEQFEAAVKIAPSLAEAHYNLGMVLYRQGKDAEAKPHFLRAAALAPGRTAGSQGRTSPGRVRDWARL
jgi:tetratricopeptide (TPR) repeat protein